MVFNLNIPTLRTTVTYPNQPGSSENHRLKVVTAPLMGYIWRITVSTGRIQRVMAETALGRPVCRSQELYMAFELVAELVYGK